MKVATLTVTPTIQKAQVSGLADVDGNLILPGFSELILAKAGSIRDRQRKVDIELKRREHENIKTKTREVRLNQLRDTIFDYTKTEAKNMGVNDVLYEFDDQTLMMIQKKAVETIEKEAGIPFWKLWLKNFRQNFEWKFQFGISIAVTLFLHVPYVVLMILFAGFNLIDLENKSPFDNSHWIVIVSFLTIFIWQIVDSNKKLKNRLKILKKIKKLKCLSKNCLMPIANLRNKMAGKIY